MFISLEQTTKRDPKPLLNASTLIVQVFEDECF